MILKLSDGIPDSGIGLKTGRFPRFYQESWKRKLCRCGYAKIAGLIGPSKTACLHKELYTPNGLSRCAKMWNAYLVFLKHALDF